MYYILERGGEKIMKKRWFVVILTIGLLLHVLPLSVLALSPDPTITDSDGTILDWSDLSTVPYSLDDLQEQEPPVPDLLETGSEKSLADADNDEAPADDLPAGNLTPKTPDEETDDDGSADDDGSTTTPPVCKIDKIDDTYYYSTLDDAITAATDGDQIDLLKDIEWYTGLEFHSKNLTISGGNTYTLTLNQNGMYASHSDITFKDLTLNIYAHTHTHEGGAGGTANLISNSNLRLNNVNFTLIPDGSCGSGIYLYQKSNLYLDGSYAVIRGVSNYRASGIYADDSEFKGQPNREIKINNSYLEITGCAHAAMTIDPIDITLSSSNVVVMDNGESLT